MVHLYQIVTFFVDLMVPARGLIVFSARVTNLDVILVLELENVTSSVAALFVEDGARLVLAVLKIISFLCFGNDPDSNASERVWGVDTSSVPNLWTD